jgi:hypothetical protein
MTDPITDNDRPVHLPAVPENRLPAVPSLTALVEQQTEYYVSFLPAGDEQDMLVLNALSDADTSCKAVIGERLDVTAFIVKHGQKMDQETGEVTATIVTVLILADGRTVATTSGFVREFVARLQIRFGHQLWKPPVPIILSLKQLGPDRTAIKARLHESFAERAGQKPAEEVPGGKKRKA